MPRILVVDPEVKVRRSLKKTLTRAGYGVLEARTAADGFAVARAESPDLVLVDLDLPDMNGDATISRLRTQSPRRPLIVISRRSDEIDLVSALDLGADDYLTKPFGDEELLARIRVALRRRAARIKEPSAVINVGDLTLDLDRRLVFARRQEVHLTPNEYALFAYLMKHVDRVVAYDDLLNEVRGAQRQRERTYLRVYMVSLRKKLEADPSRPIYLLTEPKVGYRLHDPT